MRHIDASAINLIPFNGQKGRDRDVAWDDLGPQWWPRHDGVLLPPRTGVVSD